MTTNKLTAPKACAIMYKNHFAAFGFTKKELIDFMALQTIDSFFDILISKYVGHIEFMIHVAKTDDEFVKIHRTTVFHSIVLNMYGVAYESLTNSYQKEDTYDCLTAKCMLHAINK
ncbi:hypothetical protein IMCC3317_10860 [Kordia antarctica]|uniref:Uncharacterized protein n=1 Tax=Kordia antarctica TaxID=1218801 RepID=A0A7L4ZG64_9FLAO|nr:hypothetical protein [Kordia antarctica]QHI35738.1 hypothetical protein IMCC3317_10860 [Kordia antarctica]